MNLKPNEDYNIIYAKVGGRPRNKLVKTRLEVVEFLLENLNDIDLIVINDVYIDKNKFVKDNIKIERYLKLKKLYDL